MGKVKRTYVVVVVVVVVAVGVVVAVFVVVVVDVVAVVCYCVSGLPEPGSLKRVFAESRASCCVSCLGLRENPLQETKDHEFRIRLQHVL